jgi:hypothetical protein
MADDQKREASLWLVAFLVMTIVGGLVIYLAYRAARLPPSPNPIETTGDRHAL